LLINCSSDDVSVHYYRTSDYSISNEIMVLEIGYHHLPKGMLQNYKRDQFILHYVVNGKGSLNEKKFSKGASWLIVPCEPETTKADNDEPYETYWIAFKGPYAKRFISLCGYDMSNHLLDFDEAEECAEIIRRTLFDIHPQNAIEESAMLQKAFYEIIAVHLKSVKYTSSPFDELLKSVTLYLESNFDKKILISEMSEKMGYTRNHISRLFKKQYGISPCEYVLNLRIEKAKKLLEDNKFSIDQISTAVGYDDASYFSKIFLRKTKMTPSQYRKKILNYTGEEG